MKYDHIMCMMVDDTVKTRDAGGFAPGSKAKIVVENEGTQYETYAVEYGGQPLKRGFKTREAAKNYAKSQGLTTDNAIDEVIRSCDKSEITYDEIKSVYNIISEIIMNRSDEGKVLELLKKAQCELLTLAVKAK